MNAARSSSALSSEPIRESTLTLRQAFKASGLFHLLAVSGQNIVFIGFGVLGLAYVAGLGRKVGHTLAIAAILAYALAVGWQPSVVRAAVAGCLASLAWLLVTPE